MSDEQYISDETKQQIKEGAIAFGKKSAEIGKITAMESLEIGKQAAADAAATAADAADAALACATSGFIPVNPIDWVISYIPNIPVAIGIIIAFILMLTCLGFLFGGSYGTAANLFIAAVSVGLIGYGIGTALTWIPIIGGRHACRKGTGGTVINALNRVWAFGNRMKQMTLWPVTYPLALILQFNLLNFYLLWLPISF